MSDPIVSETDTLIVGGAQAGLAASYWLTQRGVPHRVLERAPQVAPAWRTQRWDSFTLATPNWTVDLPGAPYAGDAPDDFMPAAGVVAYLEDYVRRFGLPLECGVIVTAVRPRSEGGFVVETSTQGFSARKVEKKLSLRASATAELHFDDMRVPGSALLLGTKGIGSALRCLNEARFGIAWGVIGAAMAMVVVITTSICTCWTSLVMRVISDGAPKVPTSRAEKAVTRWKSALRTSRPKPMATRALR